MSIRLGCRELEISRSGYYAWLKRPESARKKENKILLEKIKEIHQESKKSYGVPRISSRLKQVGHPCGKNRVYHLMKKAGISGLIRSRFRVKTTDSRIPIIITR